MNASFLRALVDDGPGYLDSVSFDLEFCLKCEPETWRCRLEGGFIEGADESSDEDDA